MEEQRTVNPLVGGSNPPLSVIFMEKFDPFFGQPKIEKPKSIQDLIKQYKDCKEQWEITDLCYKIMDEISKITWDTIEEEKKQNELWEKFKKTKEKQELFNTYIRPQHRIIATLESQFHFSEEKQLWWCIECGEKFIPNSIIPMETEFNIKSHNCQNRSLNLSNDNDVQISKPIIKNFPEV